MGGNWIHVRDQAQSGTLSKKDDTVADIASRFDQLIRYAALLLGSEIGEDVTPILSRSEKDKPPLRLSSLVKGLVEGGTLGATLRIPNTAGDFEIIADLRAQQLSAAIQVAAPEDRGAKARVTWLLNQLKEAPASTDIEAFAKNARTPVVVGLGQARENRDSLLGENRREPVRFRVVLRLPMGTLRKSGGKRPGFIDSVLNLITSFYEGVVQDITPWQPSAPKIQRSEPEVGDEEPANSYLPATIFVPATDEG
jgi:hypothetical protein